MELLESNLAELIGVTSGIEVAYKIGKDLEQRLTGRFYTHERIGRSMVRDIANRLIHIQGKELRIIDPFCGDGRLVCWLIEELFLVGKLPTKGVEIVLWDCDKNAVKVAEKIVRALFLKISPSTKYHLEAYVTDSFCQVLQTEVPFDICVTNPPWETIKPDNRELAELDEKTKSSYIALLKEKVTRLEKAYPHSKPSRKFSGWGANLARCGIEASIRLVKQDGHFGIVAPASIFGDQISAPLRAWLLTTNRVATIHHFPAEARLFDGVDQSAVYFVGDRCDTSGRNEFQELTIDIVKHPDKVSEDTPPTLTLDLRFLESHDYSIGFTGSTGMSSAMPYLIDLPKLGDFESTRNGLIKLGRELDETRIAKKLCQSGTYRFIKGRQVSRYSFDDSASEFLIPEITPPASANYLRVVWRDVARQSSVRRMIATLLSAGYVTGNSLNILTVKVGHEHLLKALLAVLNSTIFEAQVRASISTNHLSVGAIRKIRVPNLMNNAFVTEIGLLVEHHLSAPTDQTAAFIDTAVARWYGLPDKIYTGLLDLLEMNAPDDVAAIRQILADRVAFEKAMK